MLDWLITVSIRYNLVFNGNLMRSTSSMCPVWKRRLVRGIALFFVLFAFVDLAFPELCGEGVQRFAGETHALAPADGGAGDTIQLITAVNGVASNDSHRDQSPDQKPHAEDCFGCCGHVLPHLNLLKVSAPTSVPLQFTSARDDLPSPPLQSPYHPPRLA